MHTIPPALQFLLLTSAGWANRRQQKVIDYLLEENRVLRQQLGGRRRPLTDTQRRRLAAKGKLLGRKLLGKFAGIVTPDTILRWHRKLIAQKYDSSGKRGPGRPRTAEDIAELVITMANANPTWGYTKIRVLFVIELSTRKIEIAGITVNPTGAWMKQVGRNLRARATSPASMF